MSSNKGTENYSQKRNQSILVSVKVSCQVHHVRSPKTQNKLYTNATAYHDFTFLTKCVF